MAAIRIATFNIENLFSSPSSADSDRQARDEGTLVGSLRFTDAAEGRLAARIAEAVTSDDKRQLSALALAETKADILCLQEVESAAALDLFYDRYLKRMIEPPAAAAKRAARLEAARRGRPLEPGALRAIDAAHYYDTRVSIDGNDTRGIDVAVMSRVPLKVRTHAHRTYEELGVWSDELRALRDRPGGRERKLSPSDRVFKRDCLEVEAEVSGAKLTLFICHFKSMTGSRELTRPQRSAEAAAVRAIIEERFGRQARDAPWAICGDLNDYRELDGMPALDDHGKPLASGLDPLFRDGFAVNLMQRRQADDRWTTYHGAEDQYAQLDYILVSPGLAAANPEAVPDVIRAGQPWRAARYDGPRYPRVGWDRPKASDHAPVAVTLEV